MPETVLSYRMAAWSDDQQTKRVDYLGEWPEHLADIGHTIQEFDLGSDSVFAAGTSERDIVLILASAVAQSIESYCAPFNLALSIDTDDCTIVVEAETEAPDIYAWCAITDQDRDAINNDIEAQLTEWAETVKDYVKCLDRTEYETVKSDIGIHDLMIAVLPDTASRRAYMQEQYHHYGGVERRVW